MRETLEVTATAAIAIDLLQISEKSQDGQSHDPVHHSIFLSPLDQHAWLCPSYRSESDSNGNDCNQGSWASRLGELALRQDGILRKQYETDRTMGDPVIDRPQQGRRAR